jgi:hypothetical protein
MVTSGTGAVASVRTSGSAGPPGGQVDPVGTGAADERLDAEEAFLAVLFGVHVADRAGFA